jgi:hypothetical protein
VGDHHGDLCHHDGKVYVAVNFGPFNQPEGAADSWVYVYDAESLEELARHPVPDVVHGAGGIAYHDGRFLVVGGLPEGVEENYAYEYDEPFRFRRRHVVPSSSTLKGIQTATFADDHWWFGCYGEPRVLLKADQDFETCKHAPLLMSRPARKHPRQDRRPCRQSSAGSAAGLDFRPILGGT